MLNLTIGDLAEVTNGCLHLATMPPLAGAYEPCQRVVLETQDARPGDVYWQLAGPSIEGPLLAQSAFVNGALGVVTSSHRMEPWAGKFVLHVSNTSLALWRLARCLGRQAARRSWLYSSEFDGRRLVAELANRGPSSLEELDSHHAPSRYYPAA